MKGYKGIYLDSKGNYYTETDKRYYFEIGKTYRIPENKEIILCNTGFHFCENIIEIYNYMRNVTNLKIAEIETEGELVSDGIRKYSTRAFKIIRILTENEINDILKKETDNKDIIYKSKVVDTDTCERVFDSRAIAYSLHINNCSAVSRGNYIQDSCGISDGAEIISSYGTHKTDKARLSNGVVYSENIITSDAVSGSEYIINSKCVIDSKNIANSSAIRNSYGVIHSDNVEYSFGISASTNIKRSYYLDNCYNVSNALFCSKIENCENIVFNKKVSEERFGEIYRNIHNLYIRIKGYPNYINEANLLTDVERNYIKDSYSFIKNSIWEYIFSLEEFDENIFFDVTGLSSNEIKEKLEKELAK